MSSPSNPDRRRTQKFELFPMCYSTLLTAMLIDNCIQLLLCISLKLSIFIAVLFSMKNVTIWHMASCDASFLSKVIHSWLSEVRSVKLLIWDQSQDTIIRAIYQLLKILTVMIRAHDGHAECCLNYRMYMYTIGLLAFLIVNFKWNACKKWTSSLKLVVIFSTMSLHWNCAKNI